jgi:hypothetical protein
MGSGFRLSRAAQALAPRAGMTFLEEPYKVSNYQFSEFALLHFQFEMIIAAGFI